jgi:hypothetical protein
MKRIRECSPVILEPIQQETADCDLTLSFRGESQTGHINELVTQAERVSTADRRISATKHLHPPVDYSGLHLKTFKDLVSSNSVHDFEREFIEL